MSRKLISIVVLLLFAGGCSASNNAPVMLAKIEWQAQSQRGNLLWREVTRDGHLRGSPDETSPDFSDFLNVGERVMPETNIAEVWELAREAVLENEQLWQEAPPFAGEGQEQLSVSFCHERRGWQMLSLQWPAGGKPQSRSLQELLSMLKRYDAAAKSSQLKSEDLLQNAGLRGESGARIN